MYQYRMYKGEQIMVNHDDEIREIRKKISETNLHDETDTVYLSQRLEQISIDVQFKLYDVKALQGCLLGDHVWQTHDENGKCECLICGMMFRSYFELDGNV